MVDAGATLATEEQNFDIQGRYFSSFSGFSFLPRLNSACLGDLVFNISFISPSKFQQYRDTYGQLLSPKIFSRICVCNSPVS
jgi:hypothetical protein